MALAYYSTISAYPMFYLLKGDYGVSGLRVRVLGLGFGIYALQGQVAGSRDLELGVVACHVDMSYSLNSLKKGLYRG